MELKYSNAADLLPVKMMLDAHMSHKRVANIFASRDIPLKIIGQSNFHLPFKSLCGLYEQAARSLGDPGFGVSCGAQWDYALPGPIGEYATAAPNLKQCLNRLISTLYMFESGTSGSLTRYGELVKFSYFISREHPLGRNHLTNATVGVMLDVMRHYRGKEWLPIRIETDSRKAKDSTFLEEFVEVPVESGKAAISLIFPAIELDAPNPHQDTAFADYTLGDLGMLLNEIPPCTFGAAVSQVVRMRLLDGLIDLEGTARQLKLGVRSLQRRLSIEGESYRNILARERCSRATDLLSGKDNSITEIARMLGYEYAGDFTRAFTKAKGFPPSAIHRSRQKGS